MELCFFLYWWVVSTWFCFDNSSNSECVCVCVCVRVCVISVIVVVLARWRRFTLSDQTSAPHRPNQDRRGRKCCFILFCLFAVLLFFVRHFSLFWFDTVWTGNLPPPHHLFQLLILYCFIFALEKTAFGFFCLFCLLSASFSYSSNQYLNY